MDSLERRLSHSAAPEIAAALLLLTVFAVGILMSLVGR